ncbi:hypothetical protein FGRMN_8737 [Fusarium graminum]|nr:hypothetical protein FGRMN_8737 [Fusarium graminum]
MLTKHVFDKSDGDPINGVFRDFGSRICETAQKDQRRLVHDEIQSFTESCAAEQGLRLAGHVPDFESYMKLRIGTVGGRMLCSLVPYATQEILPRALPPAPEVNQIWTQVCILLTLLNDMLSLKKELRTDCVINAVVAMMEPDMTLDVVVTRLEERMRLAVREFDDAAQILFEKAKFREDLKPLVMRYVDGCRAIVTGTLNFTFVPWFWALSLDINS